MPSSPRSRPWYLLFALSGALAFGTGGGCGGLDEVKLFSATSIEPTPYIQEIVNGADRDLVLAAFQQWLAARDAAQAWLFPLAIATMLVGTAAAFFAMRAMAWRESARATLVQLLVVQAALAIATFACDGHVRATKLAFELSTETAILRQRKPDWPELDDAAKKAAWGLKLLAPAWLIARTTGSALLVLALTRRGARAFFSEPRDPAPFEQ